MAPTGWQVAFTKFASCGARAGLKVNWWLARCRLREAGGAKVSFSRQGWLLKAGVPGVFCGWSRVVARLNLAGLRGAGSRSVPVVQLIAKWVCILASGGRAIAKVMALAHQCRLLAVVQPHWHQVPFCHCLITGVYMALLACHECQGQVSDEAKVCPHCGAKVKKPAGEGGNGVAIGVTLLVLLVLFVVINRPAGAVADEKSRERQVIEVCWEEQRRPSVPPDQKYVMAGVCEDLEVKFIQKHGHRP